MGNCGGKKQPRSTGDKSNPKKAQKSNGQPAKSQYVRPEIFDEVMTNRLNLAKILMYDLNLEKKPQLSIAKRFARENTNDNGDNINISVSELVYLELRKYFYLCLTTIN